MIDPALVTLDHGEGGDATMRFIREEVLSRFANEALEPLEDGSWVSLENTKLVLTTDSFIVEPPFFPGGDIGKLAICGTVNDLLASGARPAYMTLALILSEGLAFSALRRILDSASVCASQVGVRIVAGDTKVLPRGPHPGGIYINTTGLGIPYHPEWDYATSHARPGDKVILTGSVGDHALAVLSAREGLGFERRIASDCAPLHDLIGPFLEEGDGHIRCLRDPTRAGLAGALLSIAQSSRVDVFVNDDRIVVHPEVRFGCEMLGLDPLRLANEGKFVMVVTADRAEAVCARLKTHPLGRESSVIATIASPALATGQVIIKGAEGSRVLGGTHGRLIPRLC